MRLDRRRHPLYRLPARRAAAGPAGEGDLARQERAGDVQVGADVAAACHVATLDDLLSILAALGDPNSPQLWPLVGGHYDEEQQDRRRREVADSFLWMRLAIEAAALP